jgi:single-strand DNA-binding protein
MAEGLNKVILIGNLGMDPELKYTQGGGAVLRLRMATTETYVDKNKQRQERVEWHTVVVWGNRAEALNKILAKGRSIGVEGRLQTRQWEDKDGGKRSTTEVVATNVLLLGGGRGEGGGGGGGGGGSSGGSRGGEGGGGRGGGGEGGGYGGRGGSGRGGGGEGGGYGGRGGSPAGAPSGGDEFADDFPPDDFGGGGGGGPGDDIPF